MSDKMREAFEKVAEAKGCDLAGHYSATLGRWVWLCPYTADLWDFWQAAQSAAVPVVGEVVAWVNPDDKGLLSSVGRVGWYELIEKPTTSIAAAELDALRKDAERLDSGMIITSERDEFGEDYSCHRRGINLREAIDAAIAGETE